MMADTSWKSHLAALKHRRNKKSGVSDSSKSPSDLAAREEVHMIGVVSPETPMMSPEEKVFGKHGKISREEEEQELSLRDSYLQRRILEITSSTSWLSASVDDEENGGNRREYLKNVVSPEGADGGEKSGQGAAAGKEYLSDDAQEKDVFSFQSSTSGNCKKDFGEGSKRTSHDEEVSLHRGRSPPTTPTRSAKDQYQPMLSESPSTHHTASTTATKKANVKLPSEKASGRIVISPGRKKEDSEFARRLRLSEGCKDDKEDEEKSGAMNDGILTGKDAREATLEDEWKIATTSDGRKYFYNRRSRVSAWKLPDGARLVESAGQSHSRQHTTCASVQSSVSQVKTGLFCMFCGVNPSVEGSSLEGHLNSCSRFDVKDGDAIQTVYTLAAKMGLLTGASVLGDRQSQASQLSQVSMGSQRYEDSFDSFASTTDGDQGLEKEKCNYCGRTFAMGRLAHHEPSCRESHSFKTVPWDSGRKRTQGTALEFHHAKSPSEKPRSGSKPNTPSDRNRR
jgi:hypothetical protein